MRWLKFGLAIMAGVVAVLAAAAGLFALPYGHDVLRHRLGDMAEAATGRAVTIGGPVSLDWWTWTPSLVAADVRLANTPWGSRPDMARIRRVAVRVALRPLLHGRVEVLGLSLDGVDLLLEKNQAGEGNWRLSAATTGSSASGRSGIPTIEHLSLTASTLTYRDPARPAPLVVAIDRLDARDQGRTISLTATGRVEDRPMSLDADFGDYATLHDPDLPYPLALSLGLGGLRARVAGHIDHPLAFTGIDTRVALSGPSMYELHQLLGLPLPTTPRFRVAGRLRSQAGGWRLDDLRGRLGGSDLTGSAAIATNGAVPRLTAEIAAHTVELDDFAGFIGKTRRVPGSGERVFSTEPFDLSLLRRMDADVGLRVDRIGGGRALIERIEGHLRLDGGRLTLDPLTVGLAGGTVTGRVAVDGAGAVPAAQADLRLRRIDLGRLTTSFSLGDSVGRLGGQITFTAAGGSLAAMAANTDGHLVAFMGQGHVSRLVLELLALNLPNALVQWLSGDSPDPINCIILPFDATRGLISGQHLMIDAQDYTVIGKAVVDIGDEHVHLTLTPYPKRYTLFNAITSITIDGDLRRRQVHTDPWQVAGELVLKTVLAPLSPVLSMMAEDHDACAPVRSAARGGAR